MLHLVKLLSLCMALIVVAAATASSQASRSDPRIFYSLGLDNADTCFHVSMEFTGSAPRDIVIHFPQWAPGSYNTVGFGNYVSTLRAVSADGAPLAVDHLAPDTYTIGNAASGARISYKVRQTDLAVTRLWVTGSRIEPEYAFANGAALFGYIDGLKEVPVELEVTQPEGWEHAIPLEPASTPSRYRARNYDELIDAPVQFGRFTRIPLPVDGVGNEVTVSSGTSVPPGVLRIIADSTARIMSAIDAFFGDTLPEPYLFQMYLRGEHDIRRQEGFFGGLEHRNATTISLPYRKGDTSFTMFWKVIAHEYFHRWNPKRFHPGELGPFEYQKPLSIGSIWFIEGLTEYYANLLLVRTGTITPAAFLYDLRTKIEGYDKAAAATSSIADRSRRVATITQDEFLTFYTQGALLGLFLDMEIRESSKGKRSLDDVMRYLNERYGRTGTPFRDGDLAALIEQATNAPARSFYRRYIAGRERLPVQRYLRRLGLELRTDSITDMTLGARARKMSQGYVIESVSPESAAAEIGLRPSDIITGVTLMGAPVDASAIPETPTGDMPIFDQASHYSVLRDGATITLPAKVKKTMVPFLRLTTDDNASGAALALRRRMFGF